MNPHDPTQLPADLPVPTDDGACLHLRGSVLADVSLMSTSGECVPLRSLRSPTVFFFYPRTGVPGQPPSLGFGGEEWDSIPGARGCTPQSCGYRDLHGEFRSLGVTVLGVSTNTSEHQREFKARQHVAFEFLSDWELSLARAMRLPTFEFPVESGGPTTLLHRMAWFVTPDLDGVPRIRRVWYPVFPPDRNAGDVLEYLKWRGSIVVRAKRADDAAFVREELTKHWGGTQIWSIGRAFQADEIPALIAEVDGKPAGLVTYDVHPGGYQFEVVTLSTRLERLGIGARLLEAAEDIARHARCTRIFLTTTNDNTGAMTMYQREGWELAALHRGNVDEARKRKAQIPLFGNFGIRVRSELELEKWLE
ncbi:MAG: GNAT family N-acetyltransferase [Phycisphaerales bacterium]|nr:GNAT family N-acetyltransferase [Phycisphaerales bacterium]